MDGQINSLVYDYLVTVDVNLAGEFREENDAEPLEEESPKIKDMVLHFQTTKRRIDFSSDNEIQTKKNKLDLEEMEEVQSIETEEIQAEETEKAVENVEETETETEKTEAVETEVSENVNNTKENQNEATENIEESEPKERVEESDEEIMKVNKETVEKEKEEFEREGRDLMNNWTKLLVSEMGKLKTLMDKGEFWEKKQGEKIESKSWNEMREMAQGFRAIYGLSNSSGRDHQA